ncbi:MAG: hypothetical protein ABSA16_06655 [Thermoguttaceae bacterium]|jgi:hypothetical protein
MWTLVRRGILPGLLIIVGLASLNYGSRFHFVPVLTEQKTEVTIEIPDISPQIPPPFPGDQQFGGPPQIRKQTVQKTEEVAINISEPDLVRDVTVGGVVLNKSHELKRTYSGKAPSLCPT